MYIYVCVYRGWDSILKCSIKKPDGRFILCLYLSYLRIVIYKDPPPPNVHCPSVVTLTWNRTVATTSDKLILEICQKEPRIQDTESFTAFFFLIHLANSYLAPTVHHALF